VLKNQKYPPQVLTPEEARALLAACGASRTGLRNRALLVLLYRGGLRVGEALALRPQDVSPTGEVRVLHGKGDQARTTAVGPEALAVIDAWRRERAGLSLPRGAPLICTLAGGKLKQQYVVALMKRLARRADIEKRVHAHGLRHTFAHELVREGAPVTHVRDLLGHANLSTTDAYLRALGAGDAVKFARSRSWAA
jgi:site-specific recombinase XerD